jgi:hypothetical protein
VLLLLLLLLLLFFKIPWAPVSHSRSFNPPHLADCHDSISLFRITDPFNVALPSTHPLLALRCSHWAATRRKKKKEFKEICSSYATSPLSCCIPNFNLLFGQPMSPTRSAVAHTTPPFVFEIPDEDGPSHLWYKRFCTTKYFVVQNTRTDHTTCFALQREGRGRGLPGLRWSQPFARRVCCGSEWGRQGGH